MSFTNIRSAGVGFLVAIMAMVVSAGSPSLAEAGSNNHHARKSAQVVLVGQRAYNRVGRIERRIERRIDRRIDRRVDRRVDQRTRDRVIYHQSKRRSHVRERYVHPRTVYSHSHKYKSYKKPRKVVVLPRHHVPRFTVGHYLPYRNYQRIYEPHRHGLRSAAPGYGWYAVDKDVYLVALGTGLIVKALLY